MKCQICSGNNVSLIISLGHQPPSDEFITSSKLNGPITTYPLDLYFCNDCGLVQLGYAVDPNLLFKEYVYNTGSNKQLKHQFAELTKKLIIKYDLKETDLAIDIGCNDGTLLEGYAEKGLNVLGIDPSSVAELSAQKGIPTMIDFFNLETAKKARDKYGFAKVITATNVFAHVDDLDSFMLGVKHLMDEKGVFITESHYLLNLVKKLQYDSIYHEHLRYYSVKPLSVLFEKYGMELIAVEHVESHGGSIRVYAANKGAHEIENSVDEFIETETKEGLYDFETFKVFSNKIIESKHKLLDLLIKLKLDGKTVVGVGAPAKGNTLLNFCQIKQDLVSYLAEYSKLKIGLFAPGSLIPVIDEVEMFNTPPDYGLLLSWNLKDIIVPKLRSKGFKGKFIIPGETPGIE